MGSAAIYWGGCGACWRTAFKKGWRNMGDVRVCSFNRFLKYASFLLLFVLACSGALFAQAGSNGDIVGTVVDNTKAVIAGASVDVTNTGTNITSHTTTTSSGDFTVPYLPPGTYQVTVQAPGFEKSVTQNVNLVVGQTARVDVTLTIGAVATTVEVQSTAVQLDTDNAQVAQTVTQTQMAQLPLQNRNFIGLLFITAGAVQTVGEQGSFRQNEGNAISVDGGRPESNNYTLDGIVNTDPALVTPSVILSQDAIREFNVLSENYSAEYGYSANQINIVSKSGTNDLHGSFFEFLRNNAFDGTTPTPFLPASSKKTAELRQNQFGFVLGGPVYLPKVYDGRNKTFFLANYEGERVINGSPISGTVPTPAELAGNFSASREPFLDPNSDFPGGFVVDGGPLPAPGSTLCNEYQAGVVPDPKFPTDSTKNVTLPYSLPCLPINPATGAAFGGGVVTGTFSRLATVANATAGVFPTPTPSCVVGPSDACGGPNVNYLTTAKTANHTNQQTYRIDQDLGRAGKVFFRYTKANYTNDFPQGGQLSPVFSLNTFLEDSTSWSASHTFTIGANNVNNFRAGYLHSVAIQGAPAASASTIAALKLTGVFTNLPNYAAGFPEIVLGGQYNVVGSPLNDPTTSDIPVWEVADSFSMIRGKHTIGIGFDYRRFVEARNLATNYLGTYNYANNTIVTNSETVNGAPTCTINESGFCGTGNNVADFLLGYYNSASTFQPGPLSSATTPGNLHHYVFNYFAPYVQDDWKVNQRLTLNLGLRWDWRNVPYEQRNDLFWVDDAVPAGALCFANKGLIALGVAPSTQNFYNYCGRNNPASSSKTPFAPRFGFAYRPFGGEKTVVRGGYGIFWDSAEAREIDDSGDLYPYVERANVAPTQQAAAVAPKLTDNLFVSNTAIQAMNFNSFNNQFVAVIISDHPRNPYVQQYTLSVEHQLTPDTTLTVNYVGNRANHLLDRENINTPPLLTGTKLQTCQTDANSTAAPPNDANSLLLRDGCNFFQNTPHPDFGALTINSVWEGNSNFNAGTVKIEHRSKNLALLSSYTYAKSLDDKSAAAGIGASGAGFAGHEDDLNPRLDYAPSDFDVRHRFVNSLIYQLPVGKGQMFGSSMGRAEDLLIGGWQLGVITTFQKGFPFSVTANDPGAYLSFGMRANQNGAANVGNRTATHWFNTAAFSQPAFGIYGNSGRNILTQPGINNWDISLDKTFKMTERMGLQFRLETFNSFNHTQWGVDPFAAAPAGSAVDSGLGDPQFGDITSARPGRIVQLGAKLVF